MFLIKDKISWKFNKACFELNRINLSFKENGNKRKDSMYRIKENKNK